MTLWKVNRYFHNDIQVYEAAPHNLKGYLYCCWRWWGIKALRHCYLFKWQAERKANKLNAHI